MIVAKLGLTYEETASKESVEILIKTAELQEAKLNTLNKNQLQRVCALLEITYAGNETNAELVALIMSAQFK